MMMVVMMRTKNQIVMMRMMVMIVVMMRLMMMMVMRSGKTRKDSACFHGLAVPSLALKICASSSSGSSSAVQE